MLKKIMLILLITLILLGLIGYFVNAQLKAHIAHKISDTEHYYAGQFHNKKPPIAMSFKRTVRLIKRSLTEKNANTKPAKALPSAPLSRKQLEALDNDRVHVVKLGHSSILIKSHGHYWLIDPVFSERASPFSFAGPKRFHAPPISIDELPPIDAVFVSHNHYDHLDKASIKTLIGKAQHFYVPLGVEGDLYRWGVEPERVSALDWWQEKTTPEGTFAFTPTQHFSGRAIGDNNVSLWGSWVLKSPSASLYFSGDSGYFDGFKTIGEKYGPFDLTFIETGAYDAQWKNIHMVPEESVQAHRDVQGKIMMPIHNGTFDLAFHPWYEPLNRVKAAALKNDVRLSTPIEGEVLTLPIAKPSTAWWEAYL